MKFVKVVKADNNILEEGNFTDWTYKGEDIIGKWKRVLDRDIETNILGQDVFIKLWHYETETDNEYAKSRFNAETQHFTITNARDIAKNLEKYFIEELKRQLNIDGKCRTGVTIPTSIPEDGEFIK